MPEPSAPLDPTPTPTPTTGRAARGLLVAVLLVAGLAGLGVGAAARSRSQPATSAALGLLATARLVDVTLDPDPLARYEVFVANRGAVPVTVTAIAAQRGDQTPAVSSYRHRIAPSGTTLLPFTQPLACETAEAQTVTVRLVVHADPLEGTEGIPLNAASTGAAITVGPCALAAARFPPGWQDPARAEAVDLRSDGVRLAVAGLPGPGRVTGLKAGSWSFALAAPVPVSAGVPVTLQAGLPAGQCQDWAFQDTVPAGLQLFLDGPGAPVVYVPIGPRLSRWLMAVAGLACPASP